MKYVDSQSKTSKSARHFNFIGDAMYNFTLPHMSALFRSDGSSKQRMQKKIPYGPAKLLKPQELQRFISWVVETRRSPEADIVKIYLSFMAGLRAGEISELTIDDVTNADGSTADTIRIRADASKSKSGREIPMTPELRHAIDVFRAKYPESPWLAISHRVHRYKHQKPHAVTQWFWAMYRQLEFTKCSSHSGRRTFITTIARNLPKGRSLKDVQMLAGHAHLETTERYIECSSDVRDLVQCVGAMLTSKKGGA